jgi:hypothetical protein
LRPLSRTVLRAVTVLSVIGGALVPLGVAAPAAVAAGLSCPGGSYDLCIPAQGANEAVTGTPGSIVRAGYDFTVPGSDTSSVTVSNAYEQLTISCANHATPTVASIMVPMPTATYTAPFQQSNGWVPSGNQSSSLTYEGSFTLGDYCNGGTIDVGQPGQMLFATQVQSNGSSSLSFRSHYNDSTLSRSGSWSATVSVKPTSGGTQTIAGHVYLCSNGTQTTTEVPGGTLGATGPQTVATQPNPLGPVSVAAGTYTMTETNPPGYELAAACGSTSNTQTVVVPSGGAGVGIFYVTPTTTCPSGSGFRQSSSAYQSGVPSISTTLPGTPAGGDLLIAEVQEAEGTATTTSVTDGNLSFTLQKTVTGPSPDNTEVTIWTLLVPCGTNPGRTITATASNDSDMGIGVMEYAGLSGAIDGFSSSSGYTSGPATTVNSGAGAAANAGDLVLGFEADSGWQVNLGADTSDGYTSRVNVQNNQVAEFLDEDQTAASTGTYNAKATITYTPATAGDLMPYGFPGVPYVMGTISFAHS